MTTLVLGLTLIYAVIKMIHMLGGVNPIINSLTIPAYYTAFDKIILDEINFKMAFTIEGFIERKMKNDPRYVKWIVRMFGQADGEEYEKIIPHHKCTYEEIAAFSTPDPKDAETVEKFMADPDRGFYCIDYTDPDIYVWGEEVNAGY